MAKCLGIDLGLSKTVAAVQRDGALHVIQSRENQDYVPSVVGLHRTGQILVGKFAVDNLKMAPADTITGIQRLMGRSFRDPEVQQISDRSPYTILPSVGDPNEGVRVVVGGKEYSPVDISAEILKAVKSDAELRLNDSVEGAVITVPAYYSDRQRDAVRLAGDAAGLKVQQIIDKPVAAAIAFGIDDPAKGKPAKILVFDLGGNTFDVTVLSFSHGRFATLKLAGDMWSGADDLDFRIMDHVVQHVRATCQVDPRQQPGFMMLLRQQAENAKKSLSSMMTTDIFITNALRGADGFIDVDLELTRLQLESLILPKVQSLANTAAEAVAGAGLAADQIDQVLLVGGSTAIPMLRDSLGETFREAKIRFDVDPSKCVAFGAALLSERLATGWMWPPAKSDEPSIDETGESLPSMSSISLDETKEIVIPRTSLDFGTAREDGSFEVIIQKGTPFPMPVPKVHRFYTPTSNLRRLRIPIYAGSHDIAVDNDMLGNLWLELPAGLSAGTAVELEFSLDSDGILKKIPATLSDGSSIEIYVERGDDKRSRVEHKLEELAGRRRNAGGKLTQLDQSNIDSQYDKALSALSRGDTTAAEENAQMIENTFTQAENRATQPAPKAAAPTTPAPVVPAAPPAVLPASDNGWLSNAIDGYKFDELVARLRTAAATGDVTATETRIGELGDAVAGLRLAWHGLITLHQFNEKADQLRLAQQDLDSALKRGDMNAMSAAMERIGPLVAEMNTLRQKMS